MFALFRKQLALTLAKFSTLTDMTNHPRSINCRAAASSYRPSLLTFVLYHPSFGSSFVLHNICIFSYAISSTLHPCE